MGFWIQDSELDTCLASVQWTQYSQVSLYKVQGFVVATGAWAAHPAPIDVSAANYANNFMHEYMKAS